MGGIGRGGAGFLADLIGKSGGAGLGGGEENFGGSVGLGGFCLPLSSWRTDLENAELNGRDFAEESIDLSPTVDAPSA